jgi:hypothetical protein
MRWYAAFNPAFVDVAHIPFTSPTLHEMTLISTYCPTRQPNFAMSRSAAFL